MLLSVPGDGTGKSCSSLQRRQRRASYLPVRPKRVSKSSLDSFSRGPPQRMQPPASRVSGQVRSPEDSTEPSKPVTTPLVFFMLAPLFGRPETQNRTYLG